MVGSVLRISCFLLVVLLSFFASSIAQSGVKTEYRTVLLPNGVSLKAEVADTPKAREQGLMFRKALPEGEGMLFVFEQAGYYRFWTKNCFIPLDMIWLDRQRKIIYIAESVPPCKKDPCPLFGPGDKEAHYVLEAVGGFAKQNGLERGAAIRFL